MHPLSIHHIIETFKPVPSQCVDEPRHASLLLGVQCLRATMCNAPAANLGETLKSVPSPILRNRRAISSPAIPLERAERGDRRYLRFRYRPWFGGRAAAPAIALENANAQRQDLKTQHRYHTTRTYHQRRWWFSPVPWLVYSVVQSTPNHPAGGQVCKQSNKIRTQLELFECDMPKHSSVQSTARRVSAWLGGRVRERKELQRRQQTVEMEERCK